MQIEYRNTHGDADVPATYPTGETLGQWVHKQRALYKEGTLDKDRHVLLEHKGFLFEPGTNVSRTVIENDWKRRYKELQQFKLDHGHVEVSLPTINSVYLDRWISRQRCFFKKKKVYKENETIPDFFELHKQNMQGHGVHGSPLSIHKIRLLEEVGIDLHARKKTAGTKMEAAWESMLNEVMEWREEHGNCLVPTNNGKLGRWVRVQRKDFNKGKLREDRIKRLRAIGFVFDPRNKSEGADEDVTISPNNDSHDSIFNSQVWMNNYDALKGFVEKNGHADVPLLYKDDNIEGLLHNWINNQRRHFEKHNLPSQQIDMLEQLGVDLSEKSTNSASSFDIGWMNAFHALEQFQEEHGHLKVPQDYLMPNADEFGGERRVAKWLQRQRQYHWKNKLSEDRRVKLESLGVDMNLRLKAYVPRNKKKHHEAADVVDEVILGKMPDDNLWFDHEDGVRRRVPSTWKFPRLNLENMYVLYHCRHHWENKELNISPMKLFNPTDMVNNPKDKTHLSQLKRICSIIDQECLQKGIMINGLMTAAQARRCVYIGYPALNIPTTTASGKTRDATYVLNLSWASINNLRYEAANRSKSETKASAANEDELVVTQNESHC
ncbi:hypothetical protein ACHAXR_004861 [Thalassiosira sp. AJA248-18]